MNTSLVRNVRRVLASNDRSSREGEGGEVGSEEMKAGSEGAVEEGEPPM